MADFKPNILENRAAFCASNTSVLHRCSGTDMFVWLKLFFLVCVVVVFFICVTSSLTGNGSQAAPAFQVQTVGAHRWAAAALP